MGLEKYLTLREDVRTFQTKEDHGQEQGRQAPKFTMTYKGNNYN